MMEDRFLIWEKEVKIRKGEEENESCGAELESRYQNEGMITDIQKDKQKEIQKKVQMCM